MRQLGESTAGAGLHPEKIDEHALVERGVLIDQDSDSFISGQRAQDSSSGILFFNDAIARKSTALLHQAIDAGMIQRTDHDIHWGRHQGVRESAELPVAEMRGSHQNAAAPRL